MNRRERLVYLHDVEILHRQLRALEKLPAGRHRADAHNARVDAHRDAVPVEGYRFEAELFRLVLAHHENRRAPVAYLAGVSGRHGAAFIDLLEYRRELAQFFHGSVGPRALVFRDDYFLFSLLDSHIWASIQCPPLTQGLAICGPYN